MVQGVLSSKYSVTLWIFSKYFYKNLRNVYSFIYLFTLYQYLSLRKSMNLECEIESPTWVEIKVT